VRGKELKLKEVGKVVSRKWKVERRRVGGWVGGCGGGKRLVYVCVCECVCMRARASYG
jgi:hypothetical protein